MDLMPGSAFIRHVTGDMSVTSLRVCALLGIVQLVKLTLSFVCFK